MSALPHILQKDDGSYLVVVMHTSGDGSSSFTFSDIEFLGRKEVQAYVAVDIHIGEETTPYECRINIASNSAREGYARSMGRISKNKQEFDSYLSLAISAVMKAVQSKPRMIRLCDAPQKENQQWLLEPFVLDGSPNILFGEGGGGKTFVALRWLLSIATGIPFLGVKPARTVPCMFLDYEDTAAEANDRIQKLCGSTKLTPDAQTPDLDLLQNNIHYFNAEGVPIHDLIPQLKEQIAKCKIQFILIDSAVMACGGEPEKAEAAGRFFNSLAKLGVTTLTIAHETKSENHDHVFGSIFWRNCARNMWNAQSEKDPVDNRKSSFGLFHRKCNHDAPRQPVPLRIFHGEGFVDIERGQADEWGGKALSIPERITAVLRSGPKQFGQIVDALQQGEAVKKDVITNALTRMKNRGILSQRATGSQEWEIA